MANGESPASTVLRSLAVDPDAPLVGEPGPLSMHPSAFTPEIVPVTTMSKTNPETPEVEEEVTVTKDDGIRPTSTVEKLGTMKPAFKADGTATAGNSSHHLQRASEPVHSRRCTYI